MVDPPREIAWTGTTMGIEAVHVFWFQASDGGTLGSRFLCELAMLATVAPVTSRGWLRSRLPESRL